MAEGIIPFQDLAKQKLLEKCRELEFVDDVQDLRCTRCNRLALEHWYTNCGHTLCPNCKRLLSGGGFKCPQCDQFILHIEEQSADFEERVNGLLVKCPNSRYGCLLVTTVKLIMKHLGNCEWTKEHALPAIYRGNNTTEMLLEEVSKLKMQIVDMNATIGYLLNELNKRQAVEEEIKKGVEMSVEDIKSHLNSLSSELHFETSTLKAQTKNINFEQLQIHFPSKEEVKQQEQQLTKLDGKTNALFQMLDEKVDKFSQRLTKEIETINVKIKASEDKLEEMQNEDKINMDNFQHKQIVAAENNKQELTAISKDLQVKVEKCNDNLKMELHKLTSEITLELKHQGASFNQKLSSKVKQLDDKINNNKTKVELMEKETKVKIAVMKSEMKKQELEQKRTIATNIKNLNEKFSKSTEELKKQLVEVKAEINESLEQEQLCFNQILKEEISVSEEKLRSKQQEIDDKINIRCENQEVIVTNCKRDMATFSEEIESKVQLGLQEVERHIKGNVEKSTEEFNNQLKQLSSQMSHDIWNKTEKLERAIEQLNKETSGFKKNIDEIFNFLLKDYRTKVQTIQQRNPQLNSTEAFERAIAIEQLVYRKSSVQQLIDSFLFGSANDQMAIEFLCLKWTIKHFEQLIPKAGCIPYMCGICPVYGYQLKAQLMLTVKSEGTVELRFCFKDEERNGQIVDVKPFSKVAFIIKNQSGHNKPYIIYCYSSFNFSLKYNQFNYSSNWISKSQWSALVSPCDASVEVLVLVEPPTISNKPLSVNGTITDTIKHYSKKLQMEKEGLFSGHWSPAFFTHARGFRVTVCMRLNGSIGNSSRGLEAQILIVSGEFDSQLRTEFEHETSVTLINQLDARKNITVKRQAKDTNSYVMPISNWYQIDSGGFLVNDSLTYHITIKPIK